MSPACPDPRTLIVLMMSPGKTETLAGCLCCSHLPVPCFRQAVVGPTVHMHTCVTALTYLINSRTCEEKETNMGKKNQIKQPQKRLQMLQEKKKKKKEREKKREKEKKKENGDEAKQKGKKK